MTPTPPAPEKVVPPSPCPCTHTTPCNPACTCVSRGSSHGCLRCCSYGSLEQRRQRAEVLAKMIGRYPSAPVASEAPTLPEGYTVPDGWAWTGEVRKPAPGENWLAASGRIFRAEVDETYFEPKPILRPPAPAPPPPAPADPNATVTLEELADIVGNLRGKPGTATYLAMNDVFDRARDLVRGRAAIMAQANDGPAEDATITLAEALKFVVRITDDFADSADTVGMGRAIAAAIRAAGGEGERVGG